MTIWDGLSQAFKLGRAYEKDRAAQRNDREHDALGEWASAELAKLAAAVEAGGRHRQRAREDAALALKVLGLEIGDRVWYWNWPQGEAPAWREAVVFGAGGKDGFPTVDVKLIDEDLPEHYIGFRKWGYGWQVRAWTEERPDPPAEQEMYP